MTTNKEHGINICASTIVSWITIGAFLWLVAKPILVSSVSVALADEIKQTVAAEVAPLNGAFIALLQRDINATKREIAVLEYRQQRASDWKTSDAKLLADKKIELDALLAARASLERTG